MTRLGASVLAVLAVMMLAALPAGAKLPFGAADFCARHPNNPKCQPATPTPSPTPSSVPTISPAPTPIPSGGYTFVDEFDGTALDPKWNTVKNWYVGVTVHDPSMISVHDGLLTIKATKVNGVWHGASISSYPGWSGMYGHFEARMRFTSGKGLWPAFWLAPIVSGDYREIDINETLANPYTGQCASNSGAFYSTVHLQDNSQPEGSHRYCADHDLAGEWHVYGADWRADHISFLFDGVEWYRSNLVVSTPLQVVLQMAVGGWAGAPDSTTPDPSYLDVDWVRVSP